MKFIVFLLIFLSLNSYSTTIIPSSDTKLSMVDTEKVIVGALFEEIGYDPSDVDAVTTTVEEEKVVVKKPSKGESFIQRQLRKNREKVKAKHAAIKNKPKYDDSVKGMKQRYLDNLTNMKKKNKQTLSNWKSKVKETYAHWAKMHKRFLKQLPEFKKNLVTFEQIDPVSEIQIKKKITKTPKVKFHIVAGALKVPIKGQGRRPTCSAFSGIRAIETVIASRGEIKDLSEQYFYWSSKPKCQQSPCSKGGSWVKKGYEKSKNGGRPDIPVENYCPYVKKTKKGNETQTPLESNCNSGVAQVTSFQTLSTLDEVITALDENRPVVGGFKLSPNFYKSRGIINFSDAHQGGATDSHAQGHALLLIGYIKLPQKDMISEGSVCFITANSWGEGWGRGGYGCLTENWVKNFRVKNAFISVNGVKI